MLRCVRHKERYRCEILSGGAAIVYLGDFQVVRVIHTYIDSINNYVDYGTERIASEIYVSFKLIEIYEDGTVIVWI